MAKPKANNSKESNKTVSKKKITRNELIAQREKKKLFHKYKKMLNKEKKVQDNKKQSTKESNLNNSDREETSPKKIISKKEMSTPMTTYKKIQKEFESRHEQQQRELEVRFIIYGFPCSFMQLFF